MNKLPVSKNENVGVQEVNNEVLIYDFDSNKAYCLNETSAIIWQMCDGKNSLSDIARELGKKLDAPADEGLVWLALEQLRKENLIKNEVPEPEAFIGLSRREAIKKVGLASMIALPVISSIIAPTATHAQSNCQQPAFNLGTCPEVTSPGLQCMTCGAANTSVCCGMGAIAGGGLGIGANCICFTI